MTFSPFVSSLPFPGALDTPEEMRTYLQLLYSEHVILMRFINSVLAEARKVKGAALTAADGSTVDSTYGAEEADVLSNAVVRIGEIEAILVSNNLAAEA